MVSSPHYIRELIIFLVNISCAKLTMGQTPRNMYLAGIHVAAINSFGYATHANKMIILSLLDKYYKLYCLDFCGNSTQQWTKQKTEPINLLSSITAVTQILGDGYTHTYLVIYMYIYIYKYIYIAQINAL